MSRLVQTSQQSVGALALALVILAGNPAGATAEAPPTQLWESCKTGSGAGQCKFARGLAVDPSNGHVLIGDQSNDRIVELDAWGVFLKAWGWDVVASGPDDTVADEFEICDVAANPANVCKAGLTGSGSGQFDSAQGIAVDATGSVYVHDILNNRVQKFDADRDFEWMVGGRVNKTKADEGAPEAQQNLCTAASEDACQKGTTGSGNGQFAEPIAPTANVSIAPNGDLYVGDKERAQVFGPDGSFEGVFPDPEGLLVGASVKSIALDQSGNVFVALIGKEDVLKLNQAGEELCTAEVDSPRALATDANGDLYLTDGQRTGTTEPIVRKLDSSCAEDTEFSFSDGFPGESTGIAISEGCGLGASGKYDLFASSASETNAFVRAYGPAPDPAVCPPPIVPPTIESQYTVSADTGSATVRAQINPRFWGDTTYYVQYGTEACKQAPSSCEEVELFPGAPLDAGAVGDRVTTAGVTLTGLEPNTTYHYRFVAKSSGGGPVFGEGEEACALDPECGRDAVLRTYPQPLLPKTECANQAFRTGAAARLPDCRAHEMVSPLDKDGGDIVPRTTGFGDPAAIDQSAAGGDRLTYSSYRSFGGPEGAPWTSQYMARREAGGWASEPISPPQGGPAHGFGPLLDTNYKAFGEDLCSGWILTETEPILAAEALPGYLNLYRRGTGCAPGTSGYEALTPVEPEGLDAKLFLPSLQGFSADGSHTVFRAAGHLTEDAAPPLVKQVYEHANGELRLVCVLPNGTPSNSSCSVGNDQGGVETSHRVDSVHNAVSSDGSRIFWTSTGVGEGAENGPGPLYVRIGGFETVRLSTAPARFWSAAADGSRALFNEGDNLFSFEVDTKAKTLIAADALGVMGASEDASRVYFVSEKVIATAGENGEGQEAQAEAPNLYLYDRGDDSYRFVATLAAADVASLEAALSPIANNPVRRLSRVAPDGLSAAFLSAAALTGADNGELGSQSECGEVGGICVAQVFLYDAQAEQLRCVSCDPSGARPVARELALNGSDKGGTGIWASGKIFGWTNQFHPSRALSADGSRLFFNSVQPLVLSDTNGRSDVYEWEAGESTADCEALGAELFLEAEGGCLSLISSGKSSSDSEFVDASADGRDVFFKTGSSLLPQDPGLVDVYDARASGGVPPVPAPKPFCEGQACQGAKPAPQSPTPASLSFQGEGNVKTRTDRRPRCPKGKRRVRRRGKVRCAPTQKSQRRHKRPQSGRGAGR